MVHINSSKFQSSVCQMMMMIKLKVGRLNLRSRCYSPLGVKKPLGSAPNKGARNLRLRGGAKHQVADVLVTVEIFLTDCSGSAFDLSEINNTFNI